MVKFICPVCAGKKYQEFFSTPDYELLQCSKCSLIRTKVLNNNFTRLSQVQQLTEAEKHFGDLRNRFSSYSQNLLNFLNRSTGSFIDVGCGFGWLVLEAQKRGFKPVVGIDPSKSFVELGKRKLKLDLRVASLEKFRTKEAFNVLVLNHVLEHISKPNEFLAKARTLLSTDGVILVACPNIHSLMFNLFKNRWYGLQPGEHQWQFTPASLRRLIERNGFIVTKVKVVSLDYNPDGWKGIIFTLLVMFANICHWGDQVYIEAKVRKFS